MKNLFKINWKIVLVHLIFWNISYWVLLHYFAYTDDIHLVDHLYNLLFHVSLVLVFYFNYYPLNRLFFSKQHYLIFGISSIILILLGSWINDSIFRYISDLIFPNYFFIPYYQAFELLSFHTIYWLTSMFFILAQGMTMLNRTRHRLAQTEQAKIEAELKMLKAQVNPHFLFNSLHNIYALTLADDEKSSDMVLLLSDILRYTLYEAKDKQVLLEQEQRCLKKYVELQKIRMPELDLAFTFDNNNRDLKIAPLLLLPLVENAFKHCKSNGAAYYIHADFRVKGSELNAVITNSRSSKHPQSSIKAGGIGLENLRRRLQLIYPAGHQLSINDQPISYQVILNLDLNLYADHMPDIR